ncbi:hypothetical protein ACFQ7F_39835 [Streptomyces sp. NPDC056486]|uniref:hypothetical protein n=1 Tax=Streptomyces sp. NPDC056486 TaxID=3345835 RepID=UPI0036C1ACCB
MDFWRLSAAQADGAACVVCGADFLRSPVDHVAVGRAPDAEEAKVFACKRPCAGVIAEEAERMAREMRELAGPCDDGEASDHTGPESDQTVLGYLMRDLKVLAGAETLLGVADDTAVSKYLLGMAAVHAEAAMMRARWLLAWMEGRR